ncbi:MAG: lycopene cyclase domain-containing protein [Schumannella sp.]|nr:lycopene cyclase domain-containing protein [Microbacteriaceae bacterium]
MTYLALSIPFLAVAGAVLLAAVLARRSPRWWAVALTALGALVLTAVFDNLLVVTGVVGYDEALISGVRFGDAPVEDFAYTLAAVIALPALWELLRGRRDEK